MASADNSIWNTIKSNAAPNVNYPVNQGNNYKYSRCSLSTTDSSKTPIIQSIRANIVPKGANPIAQAATTVNLGTAGNFGVLAGTAVTDVPTSTIKGDVGLSPAAGSNYAGLTAAEVTGTIYAVDIFGPSGSVNNSSLLTTAKKDLTTAYNDAAGRTPVTTIATELGDTTVIPGVYDSDAGTFLITGTLTLDAQSDPNAVFIFKTESTVITAPNSVVKLINGAQSYNVFWQVGSSATIDKNSIFKGNILALTSITLNTGATISGRALARNGAVTIS
jgi:hypothetical protein